MYVDAFHDRDRDLIHVAERIDGRRVLRDYRPNHVFYYTGSGGKHRTLFGEPCQKFVTQDHEEFKRKLAMHRNRHRVRIFESDVNPLFRCLAEHYWGAETPKLHVAFFDIEVGFDPERGFAPPEDPFNPVTAISLYLSQLECMVTLALRPPGMAAAEAARIGASFENTVVFDDERDLLTTFLDMIEDSDILSGWNSEGFDIPYLVNRCHDLVGQASLRRFCLWGQPPKPREYFHPRLQRVVNTYELVGRVHLDYLLLYQKHNTQQQHSYRLDFIGEIEVGENKTPYAGTLDDLYNKDFEKFIAYSRQDVMLLVKIDRKRRFIELANQIAHGDCVLLKTTMGSVALVEQAIINEMHALGLVAPDRKWEKKAADGEDEVARTPVVGAYVADPKVGLHDYVGCVDINSLYPSTLRALNMSPETLLAQVRPTATMELVEGRIAAGTPRAEAWDGLFMSLEVQAMLDETDQLLTIDWEDPATRKVSTSTMTAAELHAHVMSPVNACCISANGTIFRTDKDGVIPTLLGKWYAERKDMQRRQHEFADLANGVAIDDPELLAQLNA